MCIGKETVLRKEEEGEVEAEIEMGTEIEDHRKGESLDASSVVKSVTSKETAQTKIVLSAEIDHILVLIEAGMIEEETVEEEEEAIAETIEEIEIEEMILEEAEEVEAFKVMKGASEVVTQEKKDTTHTIVKIVETNLMEEDTISHKIVEDNQTDRLDAIRTTEIEINIVEAKAQEVDQ